MGVIYVMRAARATAMTPVTAMDFWVGAVATVATTAATPAATPVVTVDVTPAATAVPVPLAILACTAPPASAIGRPLPQSGRQDAPRAPISRRTQPIRASQRQAHVHMCAARIFTARAAAACPARPVPGHLATRFLTVRLAARLTTASVQPAHRHRRRPPRRRRRRALLRRRRHRRRRAHRRRRRHRRRRALRRRRRHRLLWSPPL